MASSRLISFNKTLLIKLRSFTCFLLFTHSYSFKFFTQTYTRMNSFRVLSNADCLSHLMERLSLQERLQTARPVCTEWAREVEGMCRRAKALALQIGPIKNGEEPWKELASVERFPDHLQESVFKDFSALVNPHTTLTTAHLTEELTTFLAGTFIQLRTLVVLVDDEETEEANFLHHLPRLIAAIARNATLTTLHLFFRVSNAAFGPVFPALITTIDGQLRQLQHLSLVDVTGQLAVPLFDLPNLFRTSLDTLVCWLHASSPNMPLPWAASLEAQTKPNLMRIYCYTNSTIGFTELPELFSGPNGAHFVALTTPLFKDGDPRLERFIDAFPNLEHLKLLSKRQPLGDVLTAVARLSRLSILDLTMVAGLETNRTTYNATAGGRPPLLSTTLTSFRMAIIFKDALLQHALIEELRLPEVLRLHFGSTAAATAAGAGAVKKMSILLFAFRCDDCGWQMKTVPPSSSSSSSSLSLKEGEKPPTELNEQSSPQLLDGCISRLTDPFRNRPGLRTMTVQLLASEQNTAMKFEVDLWQGDDDDDDDNEVSLKLPDQME